MKRIANVLLVTIFLGAAMTLSAQTSQAPQPSAGSVVIDSSAPAAGQSLGDYARSVRKDKKENAPKSFDNDNLPMEDKMSVVGNSTTTSDSQNGQNPASNPAITGNSAPTGKGHGSQNPAIAGNDNTDSATAGNDNKDVASSTDEKKIPEIAPGESEENRQKVYGQWQEKIAEQNSKVESLSHSIDTLQREYQLRVAEVYYDPANRARADASADKMAADLKKELEDKQKALADAKQSLDDTQENARKAGVPESLRENTAEQK